jgi:hypothetical protein
MGQSTSSRDELGLLSLESRGSLLLAISSRVVEMENISDRVVCHKTRNPQLTTELTTKLITHTAGRPARRDTRDPTQVSLILYQVP